MYFADNNSLAFLLICILRVYTLECFNTQCIKFQSKECIECTKMDKNQKIRWMKYLDIFINESLATTGSNVPLKQILRNSPQCCLAGIGGMCTKQSMFIQNKRRQSNFREKFHTDFFKLGCLTWQSFPLLHAFKSNQSKSLSSCVMDHCNFPTKKELLNYSQRISSMKRNANYVDINLSPSLLIGLTSGFFIIVVIVIIIIVSYLYSNFLSLVKSSARIDVTIGNAVLSSTDEGADLENKLLSSCDWTSSGAGTTCLAARSLAQEMRLVELVGQGRYGNVWLGDWPVVGQVAVKIFSSHEEIAWHREKEAYLTGALRHPNLLNFLSWDTVDNGVKLELWLITQYHPAGSLYHFLHHNTLSTSQLVKIASGLAKGLAFMHTEFAGSQRKPAMAHRDLKSRNILVKEDGDCCLGDLGTTLRALSPDGSSDHLLLEGKALVEVPGKAGTRRYMAPEILSGDIANGASPLSVTNYGLASWSTVISYQRADVYSMALVLWEMMNRWSEHSGTVSEYLSPYQGMVVNDPSLSNMYTLVCTNQQRPAIPSNWLQHPTMKRLAGLLTNCWCSTPLTRLTALRIKKRLDQEIFSSSITT